MYIFYLVVALGVKAVIMFPVLVCTMNVSAVLASGKPGDRKKKREEVTWVRNTTSSGFPFSPLILSVRHLSVSKQAGQGVASRFVLRGTDTK